MSLKWQCETSPGNYNKLNSYNSTRNSLCNTQTELRDPLIALKHVKVGKLGQEARRKCRNGEPWDAARSSLQSRERGGVRLWVCHLWPQAFLPERSAYSMSESSTQDRDLEQRPNKEECKPPLPSLPGKTQRH